LNNFASSWFLGGPTPPPIDPCLPKFQCRLSGECISSQHKCDFIVDCPGGTDEDFQTCGIPQGFEKQTLGPWKDDYDASYHFAIKQGRNQTKDQTGPQTDARNDPKGRVVYLSLLAWIV